MIEMAIEDNTTAKISNTGDPKATLSRAAPPGSVHISMFSKRAQARLNGEPEHDVAGVNHHRSQHYLKQRARKNARRLEQRARKQEETYRWESDQVWYGRMKVRARTVTRRNLDDLWKKVEDARSWWWRLLNSNDRCIRLIAVLQVAPSTSAGEFPNSYFENIVLGLSLHVYEHWHKQLQIDSCRLSR